MAVGDLCVEGNFETSAMNSCHCRTEMRAKSCFIFVSKKFYGSRISSKYLTNYNIISVNQTYWP